jgi:predicted Zn-dependent protease
MYRAPNELLSPHKVLGWTIQQYNEYLDTHNEREIWQHAITAALQNYQHFVNKSGVKQFPEVYLVLLALGERIEKGNTTNTPPKHS